MKNTNEKLTGLESYQTQTPFYVKGKSGLDNLIFSLKSLIKEHETFNELNKNYN
jgi:hypothetical protein